MIKNRFKRLPMAVAIGLAVLVVAACAIRLRGDESATQSSASLALKGNAMAAKLEQCRTITYEQKEALLDCQKIWAAQRSQFLRGSEPSNNSDSGAGPAPVSSPRARKDESRLPPGYSSLPGQSE
ncbi:putative entry exclusion protein TrbK-alt [Bradyrhizobium sp. USDA 10063]